MDYTKLEHLCGCSSFEIYIYFCMLKNKFYNLI